MSSIDFEEADVIDMTSFLAVDAYDIFARNLLLLRKNFNRRYGEAHLLRDFFGKDNTPAAGLIRSGLMHDFSTIARAATDVFDTGVGNRFFFSSEKSALVVHMLRMVGLFLISKATSVFPFLDNDPLSYGVISYVMPSVHVKFQASRGVYPRLSEGTFGPDVTTEQVASLSYGLFGVNNKFVPSVFYRMVFKPSFTINQRRYSCYDLFAMMHAYTENYNETSYLTYNEFCKHFYHSFGFDSILVYLLTGVKPVMFIGFNFNSPVNSVEIKSLLKKIRAEYGSDGSVGVVEELKDYKKGFEYILFVLMHSLEKENEKHFSSLLAKHKMADMRKVYVDTYYDEALYIVENIWDKMAQDMSNEDKLVGMFLPDERKPLYKLSSVTGVDFNLVEYTDLNIYNREFVKCFYNKTYSTVPVVSEYNILSVDLLGALTSLFSFAHLIERVSLFVRKGNIDQVVKDDSYLLNAIHINDALPTDGALMYLRRHFVDMYSAKINSFTDFNWLLDPFEEGFEYGNFVSRHCYRSGMYSKRLNRYGVGDVDFNAHFAFATFMLNRTGIVSCGTLSISDGIKRIMLYDFVNKMLPDKTYMPPSVFKEVVNNMPDVTVRLGSESLYIDLDPKKILLGELRNCTSYYKDVAYSSLITTESVALMNEIQDGYLSHQWLDVLISTIFSILLRPEIVTEFLNVGINEHFPVAVLSSYFVPYGDNRSVFASHIPATVQHHMDPGYLAIFNNHHTCISREEIDNDFIDAYNSYKVHIPSTNNLFSSSYNSVMLNGISYDNTAARSQLMTAGISQRSLDSTKDAGHLSMLRKQFFSPITDIMKIFDADYELATWLYCRYSNGLPRYLNFDIVFAPKKANYFYKFNVRDMLFHVMSNQIIGCSVSAILICNNLYDSESNSGISPAFVRLDDENLDTTVLTGMNLVKPYRFVPQGPFERLLKPMFLHPYYHYTNYHFDSAGNTSGVYWFNSLMCSLMSINSFVLNNKYLSLKDIGLGKALKNKPASGIVIIEKFYNYQILEGKFFVSNNASFEIGLKFGRHMFTVDTGGIKRYLKVALLSSIFNYDVHGFETGINTNSAVPVSTILLSIVSVIEFMSGETTFFGSLLGHTHQRGHRAIVSAKRYCIEGDDVVEYSSGLDGLVFMDSYRFIVNSICYTSQSTGRYKRNYAINRGEVAPMISNNSLMVFLSPSEFIEQAFIYNFTKTAKACWGFLTDFADCCSNIIMYTWSRLSRNEKEYVELLQGTYTESNIEEIESELAELKSAREEIAKELEASLDKQNKMKVELQSLY